MNSFTETLNQHGETFLNFAWPILWQSSLLIAALFAFDFLFRRKLSASIRYALWLVVLVKLMLPPTLALPTSPVWWLHQTPPIVVAKIPKLNYTVTYDQRFSAEIPQTSPAFIPPKQKLTIAAWLLAISTFVSAVLFGWLLVRWWQISRHVWRTKTSERLAGITEKSQKLLGMKKNVAVRLTTNSMSPAVCGLFRPAILIPQSLAQNFSDKQLRAVLLHELIHLRRRDVWMNFLQALLQIFYWWHPLVWLANACIRRVREEAVDDAVMLALRDEAESYAPTLLEVAKLALNRPLVSLGLVGIMESRNALRQRIERLLNFRAPKKAGLTILSCCGIFVFSAVALPMGEKPASNYDSFSSDTNSSEMKSLTIKVNPEIFIRNVKARANQYLHSPPNDYTALLLEIMRSEAVDCSPPHGIAFDKKTGEITTQNSPERLEIFRRIIEQLNRTDGICELPLHNNLHRKSVLIEARLYQMSAADFKKIASGLQFYPKTSASDSWWSSPPPDNFKQLIQTLESSGLQPLQRPRIQTGSGMRAEFYVGNATNSVDFECLPFAQEGSIDLRSRVTIISDILFTNRFNIEASAQAGGGIVIRTENFAGHGESNLVTVINMQVVTNQSELVPVKKQQNSDRPQIHIKARFIEVPKTKFDLESLTMTFNANSREMLGIMNRRNFQANLKALQSKQGFKTLSEPEVTTTSGRQTQVRATQTVTIISNIVFSEKQPSTNGSSAINFVTAPVETGPVFDVVPQVLSDGKTLNLNFTASYLEFWGYAQIPTNAIAQTATNSAGEIFTLPSVWPALDMRRKAAQVNIYDGQTIVLSLNQSEQMRFAESDTNRENVIASWIREGKKKNGVNNQEIFVFITAEIVDPAGNRVHKDDEIPFTPDGIPPQPAK